MSRSFIFGFLRSVVMQTVMFLDILVTEALFYHPIQSYRLSLMEFCIVLGLHVCLKRFVCSKEAEGAVCSWASGSTGPHRLISKLYL